MTVSEQFSDAFAKEIRRIAQVIAFGADLSGEDPLMVAAAQIYLNDQDATPTERNIRIYTNLN